MDPEAAYRHIISTSDTLRPGDKVYLLALLDLDQERVPSALREYYGDLDRADRTPREVLYFHIGWLGGMADPRLRPRP